MDGDYGCLEVDSFFENLMKKIIIAIDGHSSCGKSTFAKALAKEYGYVFIDTGAMYRAITLFSLEGGDVEGDLSGADVNFRFNEESGKSDVYLGERNVENEIRGMSVSENVSRISSIASVRKKLVEMQQKMGKNGGVVMDGRDIGTVVFPNAEVKIFMTASVDVRAMRRYKELTEKGLSVSLEEIKKNIEERDFQDENRTESPLRCAKDAYVLDNSEMTVEQQMVWAKELIDSKING